PPEHGGSIASVLLLSQLGGRLLRIIEPQWPASGQFALQARKPEILRGHSLSLERLGSPRSSPASAKRRELGWESLSLLHRFAASARGLRQGQGHFAYR